MAVVSTLVTVPGGVTSSNDIVVPGGILQVANGGAIVGTIDAQSGRAILAAGATATGTTSTKITLSSAALTSSPAAGSLLKVA